MPQNGQVVSTSDSGEAGNMASMSSQIAKLQETLAQTQREVERLVANAVPSVMSVSSQLRHEPADQGTVVSATRSPKSRSNHVHTRPPEDPPSHQPCQSVVDQPSRGKQQRSVTGTIPVMSALDQDTVGGPHPYRIILNCASVVSTKHYRRTVLFGSANDILSSKMSDRPKRSCRREPPVEWHDSNSSRSCFEPRQCALCPATNVCRTVYKSRSSLNKHAVKYHGK